MKGSKDGQTPAKEGYGQDSGGLSKTKTYERREQDGENRLLTEGDFMNRERLADNE